MSELNREQVIKALECCTKDDCDNCPNPFGNCYSNLAGYALAIIKELSEENERLRADAVEVVRCKDCKHWHNDGFDPIFHCKYWAYPPEYFETAENDFCCYGERKGK